MKKRTQDEKRRWRRACSIFTYWMGSRFVIENYCTGDILSANIITARVLNIFGEWRCFEEVCRELPEFSAQSIRDGIRQLVKNGMLLSKGSADASDDQKLRDIWASWMPHAAILHFATKDMPYTTSNEVTTARLRFYLKQAAPPPLFQSLSRKLSSRAQRLPMTTPPDSDFLRTLLTRRTHRKFSPKPLDLENLSTLLRYTWGATGFLTDWLLGDLPLKTSPSAGARHPCEVYVLAQRVKGLVPGLYHYASDRHSLRRIAQKTTLQSGVLFCAGQSWVKGAAALFLITAVFPRSMWKYRFSRAYRTVLADSAHLCQTFCLLATNLQLAPFCTMAMNDTMIEKYLGIDGIKESILYVAGVGLPAPQALP